MNNGNGLLIAALAGTSILFVGGMLWLLVISEPPPETAGFRFAIPHCHLVDLWSAECKFRKLKRDGK